MVYIYLLVLPQQEVTIRDRTSLQLAERSPGRCDGKSADTAPPSPSQGFHTWRPAHREEAERCVMRVTEKLPEASSSRGE